MVALDDEPDMYRYHHLFADLLVAEFRAQMPAEEAQLRADAPRMRWPITMRPTLPCTRLWGRETSTWRWRSSR